MHGCNSSRIIGALRVCKVLNVITIRILINSYFSKDLNYFLTIIGAKPNIWVRSGPLTQRDIM